VFLRIAPHLVHRLPFLVPTYGHGMRGKMVLSLGMKAFELIAVGQNRHLRDPEKIIRSHQVLSPRDVLELEPGVETRGLTGGVRYDECHMHSSERTTLAVVLAAAGRRGDRQLHRGGVHEEGGWQRRVVGVRVRALTHEDQFEIRARLVANVTGPWAPPCSSTSTIGRRAGGAARRFCPRILTRPLTQAGAARHGPGKDREPGRPAFSSSPLARSLIGTTNVPYAATGRRGGDQRTERLHRRDQQRLRRRRSGARRASSSQALSLVDTEVKADVYRGAPVRDHDHRQDRINE
jgi:glycerol-3-phosphate dehydrogenase